MDVHPPQNGIAIGSAPWPHPKDTCDTGNGGGGGQGRVRVLNGQHPVATQPSVGPKEAEQEKMFSLALPPGQPSASHYINNWCFPF